jgi:hypothetical protein
MLTVIHGEVAERGCGSCSASMCARIVRPGQGAVGAGVGKQQHELLAAVARRQVAGAAGVRGDGLRHLLQAAVAGRMAQAVVVQLEVVDVEHHQRQGAAAAHGALPFLFQEAVEMPAVGDLGQRVE